MRTRLVAAALGAVVVASGCTQGGTDVVVVSAAASLTDAFAAVEEAFEEENPEVDVILNFGGSSSLREQILAGAPVDVFASASASTMADIASADLLSGPSAVFATTTMQIATPAGNPADVSSLEDLADPALLVGVCAVGVPCGDRARQVLASAGVVASIDTNEPNARSLLTKIEEGELDAGITYATDIIAAEGRVDGVGIPDANNVVAEYPIAVLTGSSDAEGAATFVRFVLSESGVAILTSFGFRAP